MSDSTTPSLGDLQGAVFGIENQPPSVEAITVNPTEPLPITGAGVSVSSSFNDPAGGFDGPYTLAIDWGDSMTPDTTTMDAPGAVGGSHTYQKVGVYRVTLAVTDRNQGSHSTTYEYVVVYDPEGGFVTGGGWINSPAGACRYAACTSNTTGKANFGFVSKYQKGANVPSGNTEFQFKAGNLNFHSTNYQWLVIAGAKAKFKGEGTINGAGNYGFMLSAIDGQVNGGGGVDKFRIKIWDKDAGDAIVYDNQMGAPDDADASTEIGGGSIVIHKQ